MLLKLYDLDHTQIAGLKNYKDATVESELSAGDKTLSFFYPQEDTQKIPQEYYIRTDRDEFVVKENSKSSTGYRKIVAKLNLEDIEGRAWSEFVIESGIKEAADYALTDTGWTCASFVPADRVRKISLKKVSSYQVIEKLLDAFTCEIEWDTMNKVMYLKEQVGADRGVYFIDGLNLKEITDSTDSYDYATILVPVGADDLGIEDVNGGKNYLENYQYSKKRRTVIWEDSNYTDPQALMEDAKYKLNEISKPKRTLRAKTIDLAKISKEYSAFSYSVGDTITLISNREGIREKQRIIKTVEYLTNPENNTCDISNTVLSFEEMQKKLFAAAECINNITTDNGTVKGSSVDKIDVTQIIGLDRYIAEDVNDLKVNYLYVRTEFGTPYAVIGKAAVTQEQVTDLQVIGREDSKLSYITELHADTTYGEYAKYKTIESDNIAAMEARIDKITATEVNVEYLKAHYAQIDFANVDTAAIRQGWMENLMVSQGIIADRVVGAEIVATKTLTGVNIYADDITAGTLSVDRLVFRGDKNSIVYQLNNITGALQAENVETINGEVLTPRTISADRIVAKSITADEINVTDLIATGFIGTNRLTAANIMVNDLRAMGATIGGFTIGNTYIANNTDVLAGASSSIYLGLDGISCGNRFKVTRAGELYSTLGRVGGFTIGTTAIYNGTNSKTSTTPGIYLGTDAIRAYSSNATYTHIEGGKLTCVGATMSGTLTYSVDGEQVGNISLYTGGYGGISVQGNSINVSANRDLTFYGGAGITLSGSDISVPTHVSVGGYNNTSYALSTASLVCNSWLRTTGATGWYNETFAGGWYMTDYTYIRSYNKSVYIGMDLLCDGSAYLKKLLPRSDAAYDIGSETNRYKRVYTNMLYLGATAYDAMDKNINTKWQDGHTHAALSANKDGLTTYLGWSGSGSDGKTYTTCTVLRGSTVRLRSTSGTVVTSDERLKNSFKTLTGYENAFMDLSPVAFRYNDGISGRYHFGFRAQNVREALINNGYTTRDFAGFVQMQDDPESEDYCGFTDPMGLIYTEFPAWNTHMIQKAILQIREQDADIEQLKKAAEDLRKEVQQQKEAIEEQKKVIEQLKQTVT